MSAQTTGIKEEESLRNLVQIVRKRKAVIIIATFAGLLCAFAICLLLPDEYTSTSTLLINKDTSSGLDLGSLASVASSLGGEDDLKTDLQTHATLLQSNTTVLETVTDLDLQDKPPYRYHPGIFGWNSKLKAERGLPFNNAPATRERILKIFAKRLNVEPTQDSRLITVAVRDRDPEQAALIANKLVEVYMQEYLRTRFQATADASDWLSLQLDSLKKQVEDSQTKLSDYERKTGLSVLMLGLSAGDSSGGGTGGGGISGGVHIPQLDRLAALNAELTAAEADRIAKEAIYRLTQSESPEVVLGLSSSGLSTVGTGSSVFSGGNGLGLLQDLRRQETALDMEYGDAATKYGPRNPHLGELEAQRSALDMQIHQEMERIKARAQNDFTVAQQNEASIRLEYNKQEQTVSQLNDNTTQLEILAAEAISSRALYEDLYSKLQEANVEAGVKATNLILADQARPASTPTRPDWLKYPAIGFAVGLFLGFAGAFAWDNLDDKITTTEQIEHISAYPVLASIPETRPGDRVSRQAESGSPERNLIADPRMILSEPKAVVSEAFRSLRTAVQLSSAGKPLQILLVTSTIGGEGKSTISTHLAVAFVQQNKRVLLVDADMRKPTQHALLGLKRTSGLSEVLAGAASFEESASPVETIPGLWVLTSGIQPPNPAELLGSARFDELLATARKKFDLVILDSPPALFVTDPIILTTKVDGTLAIVRAGKTTKPAIARLSRSLAQTKGRILGFVLNGVDTKSAEYYYSYGYYGKSNYYESESKKP